MSKNPFTSASVKDTLAAATHTPLVEVLSTPDSAIIKEVRTSYAYDEKTNERTEKVSKQTITAMIGTTIDDAEQITFDYVGTPIPDKDIPTIVGQRMQLKQVSFGLIANMVNRRFVGYNATGFKLIVGEMTSVQKPQPQK
ncbi:MAG: hypothetical protein IKF58_16290 [Bacillus sp. (in: Bacteria)]|uniref:hypothetical protein n=1 Tax=Pseudolactococcus raffinolactis TaxID=1366 RepID=UPI0039AF3070|nr:hypothetical protein [Bacillus sp. (in: firmicutes)]